MPYNQLTICSLVQQANVRSNGLKAFLSQINNLNQTFVYLRAFGGSLLVFVIVFNVR